MSLVRTPGPTPTFRDYIRRISPPWLRIGWAEKLLYAYAIQLDVLGDALTAAIKLRFPNFYSNETLPLIGRERRITRGLDESDESYATRLRRWLDDHRHRGGPYAMLAQLYAFYAPNNFPIVLLYRNGRRFTMAPDGTITTDVVTWHPDANPAMWARWWLYFYTSRYAPPLSDADASSLRTVPSEWNNGHCIGRVCVLGPGVEQWNYPLGRKWNRHVKWNKPAGSAVGIDG